jgi:hypothetical protein
VPVVGKTKESVVNQMRNALLIVALLAVAGCGCVDDSFRSTGPNRQAPDFVVGAKVDPQFYPPPARKIDVLFLLDDSDSYAKGLIIADNNRVKTLVAQAIAKDTVNKLPADLAAAFPGDSIDTAFGVARYEDYGGSFRGDSVARPFILQQPILRKGYPTFAADFASALTLETPGNGNTDTGLPDSSTAVEALYQAATGAGFDGNGMNGTTESGVAGVTTTMTSPGTSGDVPAPVYVAQANDADGQPLFKVGDRFSAGNLGGVGWRPDALHYIIVCSDFATVAPFSVLDPVKQAAPALTPEKLFPFVDPTNTMGNCRDLKSVIAHAFPSYLTAAGPDPRAGNASTVGPTGRHTVQAAVLALNDLDIEVLGIGTQQQTGRGGKPNQPASAIPPGPLPAGPVAAIPNPSLPDGGPFTWMSAMAILTGAYDTSFPNPADNMPLVYNLLTLFPNPGGMNPYDGSTITNDLRSDLVDRVVNCAGPAIPPPVRSTTLTLSVDTTGTPFLVSGVNRLLPLPTPAASYTATFDVPVFAMGDPTAHGVEVRWQVALAFVDPDNTAVPATADIPVTITLPFGDSISGFTEPVGVVRARGVDPTAETARATLSSVTAGSLYFTPGGASITDPGFPTSIDNYYTALFSFP